ncbi:hypothetical protein MASR1M97_21220 [Candidatus Desulfobacillus denitrificans]
MKLDCSEDVLVSEEVNLGAGAMSIANHPEWADFNAVMHLNQASYDVTTLEFQVVLLAVPADCQAKPL